MKNSPVSHTFHVPVMGTGFSVDTPQRVARYGISSVISLVDDNLLEEMRRVYSAEYGEPYTPIQKHDDDGRARRVTAYLDLVDRVVKKQFQSLLSSPFSPGSEITKYCEMLPDASLLKDIYRRMLAASPSGRTALEQDLRRRLVPGMINVNIMTKLDRINYDRYQEPLPDIYSDALSALRGFAQSTLRSGIVFSAGLNRRLYSYVSEFQDFFPDEIGRVKKEIILKVSDYRSAVIQGRFFAKKGLWVSEYRIESGLNCGGHAFAGQGHLIGPVLAELSGKREELQAELTQVCREALREQGKVVPSAFLPFRVTVQGGIGTCEEDSFLRQHYGVDGTGWGTPFLLVPEVTQVSPELLEKLVRAREEDVYLSNVSPLGVPFHNLRNSESEENKRRLIATGRPGSDCPRGHLVSNTEFTDQPICAASRQYQTLKIAELKTKGLSAEEYQEQFHRIVAKACICSDLGDTVFSLRGIKKTDDSGIFPAVCPGPNIAYFDRKATLAEMADHIYGRKNLMMRADRPHMFIKELQLNLDFLDGMIQDRVKGFSDRKDADFKEFCHNISGGIDYYRELVSVIFKKEKAAGERFLVGLDQCRERLKDLIPAMEAMPPLSPSPRTVNEKKSGGAPANSPKVSCPADGPELMILNASHSGNGKSFARRAEQLAQAAGFRPRRANMAVFSPLDLAREKNVLFIVSTHGEGDPPAAAEEMFEYLRREKGEPLGGVSFAVLALGDKSYVHFCKAGRDLDALLEKRGAHRIVERVDCDIDYLEDASRWLKKVFQAISPVHAARLKEEACTGDAASDPAMIGYSAKHPVMATVLSKKKLSGPGSIKEVYHLRLKAGDAGLVYQPGDCCGVLAENSERLVNEVLSCLKFSGEERLSDGTTLRDTLKQAELSVLIPSVIQQHNTFARSQALEDILLKPTRLKDFMYGRDLVDLLREYPVDYGLKEFTEIIRPLPARLYSIASAPIGNSGEFDLLVGAVRYSTFGRSKEGAASTWLADRVQPGDKIKVYIRANESFRLPSDGKIPVIMVGPGTGVAPFRAFVQARAAAGEKGQSWLFFGNPHAAVDYFYEAEWQDYVRKGFLTRLSTAFSRDQKEKIYVTHRIREEAAEIYRWLEQGAFIYVSGAAGMAGDVYDAFMECVKRGGNKSSAEASDYGKHLKRSGRYLEDVY